jgi:hypothetical protein
MIYTFALYTLKSNSLRVHLRDYLVLQYYSSAGYMHKLILLVNIIISRYSISINYQTFKKLSLNIKKKILYTY